MVLIVTDRTKRVKEARDEAKKEVEEYRKAKEEEFKKFEAEVCRNISHSRLRGFFTWRTTAVRRQQLIQRTVAYQRQ